eukprot:Hpha_TRINITY_DN16764_c1_g1::TRINITY_DN16764_c1_g1_i1::g.78082::m.78082
MAGLLIFVRPLGGELVPIELTPDASVRDLKDAIERVGGPTLQEQMLVACGASFENEDEMLADTGLCSQMVIGVGRVPLRTRRIAAGGVWGALAYCDGSGVSIRDSRAPDSLLRLMDGPAVGVGVAMFKGAIPFAIALLPDGTVRVESLRETTSKVFPPRLCGKRAVQVAAGTRIMAAVLEDGSISWGKDLPVVAFRPPYPVLPVTDISLCMGKGLLLLEGGRVLPIFENTAEVPDFAGREVTHVSQGRSHNLAVLEGQQVVQWGTGLTDYPPIIDEGVQRVSAGGGGLSAALTCSGRVHIWGPGAEGVPSSVLERGGCTDIVLGTGQGIVTYCDGTHIMWP